MLTAAAPTAGRLGVPISLGYGLISAAGFGTSFVAIAAASQARVPWALLGARTAAVLAIVATALAFRFRPAISRRDLPGLVLIGALIVAADTSYATATTLGDLSIVAVLAAFQPGGHHLARPLPLG